LLYQLSYAGAEIRHCGRYSLKILRDGRLSAQTAAAFATTRGTSRSGGVLRGCRQRRSHGRMKLLRISLTVERTVKVPVTVQEQCRQVKQVKLSRQTLRLRDVDLKQRQRAATAAAIVAEQAAPRPAASALLARKHHQ
jgi:hypothetical protein